MEKKRILFITSTNLAANPRLVKELRLAIQQDFEPTVIQFKLGNWSDTITTELKAAFEEVEFIELSALRKPFWPWFISSLIEKSARLLPVNWINGLKLAVAVSKRSLLLTKAVNKIETEFKWVIAHNPAAFYPAYIFSKKKSALLGIDLEDYHPGESNRQKGNEQIKKQQKHILPMAEYVTAASSLILEYTEKDLNKSLKNGMVVLNYFPTSEFKQPAHNNDKLKLVWFSQYISPGRGLESIIPLIEKNSSVELHLYGNNNKEFTENVLNPVSNIFIHPLVSQAELHELLGNYDIGLAIENESSNLNRELCITNKLLAYFQAGLFILASDTKAQTHFINQHPEHGIITKLQETSLSKSLQHLLKLKKDIRQNTDTRFTKAKEFCWEKESIKLKELWCKV